ncbi:hypothetical protein K7432_015679 [Basidiobolus ranarum]|uniref:NAD-dependent epimerase/dehydratase domain-containing protein n=1 Tax=Basidiobolus ranarum TaxID=34480 RepID=A0ABR2WFR8_9FUNG
MKIIVTGATGFVGHEVLIQCLENSSIETVTVLSRRPIENLTHNKLNTIILQDFTDYSSVIKKLEGHVACIWCLGGKASQFSSVEEYIKITHDYALAAAENMSTLSKPFTFCYLSGAGADPTESQSFWFEQTTRYIKGRTEKDLTNLCTLKDNSLKVHIFRPAGILSASTFNDYVGWLLPSIAISVTKLTNVMLKIATNGNEKLLWEHAEIINEQ